jgi:hypothetical protein
MVWTLVGALSFPQDPPPLPELRLDDLERWREHVRPSEAEGSYLELPWVTSFAEGMRRAEAEQKPLLLWAMNGHPLGCT